MSEFFDNVRSSALAGIAKAEQSSLRFEERCVLRILDHAGIPVNVAKARADAASMFRTNGLSFLWFAHHYPQFPMALSAAKLKNTSGTRIGWTQLFGSGFGKLPWVKEYMEEAAAQDYDLKSSYFGLCFNAPHADKAGVMVVNNHMPLAGTVVDPELSVLTGETRIIRRHGSGLVLVIESLPAMLRQLGTDWYKP
jgi:hypothetical protein